MDCNCLNQGRCFDLNSNNVTSLLWCLPTTSPWAMDLSPQSLPHSRCSEDKGEAGDSIHLGPGNDLLWIFARKAAELEGVEGDLAQVLLWNPGLSAPRRTIWKMWQEAAGKVPAERTQHVGEPDAVGSKAK